MIRFDVAPLAGAWIEIYTGGYGGSVTGSLPSRERGLKLQNDIIIISKKDVAPLAGAWIEMELIRTEHTRRAAVAPLAGAWIEMPPLLSLPVPALVAPLAGAWIEIRYYPNR